jgi:hypothetical protein
MTEPSRYRVSIALPLAVTISERNRAKHAILHLFQEMKSSVSHSLLQTGGINQLGDGHSPVE